MKKNASLLVATMLYCTFLFAGVVEHTYSFNVSDLIITKSVEGYDIVSLKNTINSAKAGEPSIPYHAVSLLLPPGEKAESIELTASDKIKLEGKFNIFPHQPSRICVDSKSGGFVKNTELYSSDKIYPEEKKGNLSTEYLNGHSFSLSTFTPVEYNAVSGEYSIYQKVTVRIITTSDQKSANTLKNLSQPASTVKKIMEFDQNHGANLSLYSSSLKSKEVDDYDYLIITTSAYTALFDPLINFYFERGIKVKVAVTSGIYSLMSGVDNQEKIRNYIIQEYQNNGIEYVLLGGDIEVVPFRGFYVHVTEHSSGYVYERNDLPSDMYYSSLDGTWNSDNDDKWGEIDEEDLLPEVSVARFPFSNTAELSNMLNKTIKYQSSPVLGELRDPLIAGEKEEEEPEVWGSDYLEMLIGYREDYGYNTYGIPESQNITKLYDKIYPWSKEDLILEINKGHSLIQHKGHSFQTYNMRLNNPDVTNENFANLNGLIHNYTVIYTHGCDCGAFDYNDCILEKYVSIENFAVACIGNTGPGVYNEYNYDGPQVHVNREFNDALYGNRTAMIGTALKEANIDTAPWLNAPEYWDVGGMRMVLYEATVLGDPAMNVWTDEPEAISVKYSSFILEGQTDYELNILGTLNRPLSNINCVLIQNNAIIGKAVTDSFGNAIISIDPSIQLGDAELHISGYNTLLHSYPLNVVLSTGKIIAIESYRISTADDDIIEYGEFVIISVTLKNIGLTDASDLSMSLSEEDAYIELSSFFQNIGSINAGDTLRIDDALFLNVAGTIPDLHQFSLNSTITDTVEQWKSNLILTANSPNIEIIGFSIDDSGNNSLDPGETADVVTSIKNTGHSEALNLNGLLTSDDSHITINSAQQTVTSIGPSETQTMTFNVTASTKASNGYVSEFSVLYTADNGYIFEDNFFVNIGFQIEDFETGDFTAFNWYFRGDVPWVIDTVNQYEGTYCARSGEIGDSQKSSLVIDDTVLIDGDISFYVKTSTEGYFDPLIFSIDGIEIERWEYGILDWHLNSFPVSAGDHTFKWSFEKDEMESAGEDCVWIDYITFPGIKDATGINEETQNLPTQTNLYQNYPNPFNPETTIKYSLSSYANVRLTVFDIAGREVCSLIDQKQNKGYHEAKFNGDILTSGMYFYRLSVDNKVVASKKMMLLK